MGGREASPQDKGHWWWGHGHTPLPTPFLPQGCRIYLCGTKSDLLEEDRRKRGVDFHDVQDYVDGRAAAGCFKSIEWVGREGGLSYCVHARSSALAEGPQQIQWHQGCRLCQGTACPDMGRHMASWAKGPGALPWIPASQMSAAVPKG